MTTRESPSVRPAPGPGELALLGACLVAGWVLHDLAVFLPSGRPATALELLPPSLVAVAIGAATGALTALRPRAITAGALILAAVASALPRLLEREFSVAHSWLPRAVFLLIATCALAQLLMRRGLGTLRVGLTLGALACAVFSSLRVKLSYGFGGPLLSETSLMVVAGALPALLLGFVPRAALRRAATFAVALVPLWYVIPSSVDDLRPGRPDLGPPTANVAPGSPNLVLIVLDTVRADHLAPYGYERATTPRLDAWAAEHATRFEEARSTSSWTLSSHASLFTGLFPAEHGATAPRHADSEGRRGIAIRPAMPLRGDVPTLAERLRAAGYRTGAVVANNAYLTHTFGLDRGFEHYDDRNGSWVRMYLPLVQLTGWNPRAGHKVYREGVDISDAALAWLERHEQEPFFLMLNYMDAHDPYIPPSPFDRAFSDERPVDPLDPPGEMRPLLYDRGLGYLDQELARVLDHLQERGLHDDTVVIVTSDHGEAFGEHEYWNHAWILYEEVLRVPLYIKPAGGRARELDPRPVTGAEVPALALALVGLADEPVLGTTTVVGEWFAGRSNPGIDRWAEQVGRDVEADLLAWVEGGVKYIAASSGGLEAFDLRTDPGETTPLELTEAQREAARARAREWWEHNPPVDPALSQGGAMDQEALDRLEGLGYTGGE